MHRIRKRRGLMALIARELGLAPQTVQGWPRVPRKYLYRVSEITKIKPEILIGDYFGEGNARHHEADTMADRA